VTSSGLLVEPAYRSAPDFARTLGPEVADLASLVGFGPDPEQRLGLDLIFALDGAGKSAAFEFCVVCSRQNMKTGLFKQAALGWLFITDQRLIVWSAHEFRTAQEAFRDMDEMCAAHPSIARLVKQVYTGTGNESIELKSGARLIFKARTRSGGRGLTGDKIVLDEAFALRADHMGALLPTLSVRPDPQVVYGSSAGLSDSDVLRAVRDRGRPGRSPRLAYLEWSSPKGGCELADRCTHVVGVGGCALDDVDRWFASNPLLGRTRADGTGLTLEYVRDEREALPPAEFARERLGWWDEPDSTAAAFGAGRWEACAGAGRPDGLALGALSVAVSFDLTHAAVGSAARDGGVTFVKPLQHGPGTSWVVERVKALQAAHGVDVVVDEKGPAAVLIPALEKAAVRLKLAATGDVLDACAGLFDAVQDRAVRHESFPELDAAVAGAVKRSVGDRWAWGRKVSTADISTLEAVTLAAWWAGQSRGDPSIYVL
jgi:hypothetical protein